MRFVGNLLEPSYSRVAQFDSTASGTTTYLFECVDCNEEIVIPLASLIGKEWSWRDRFDAKTSDKIQQHFSMNQVGKTPDGSWQAVDTISCPTCDSDYLVYFGVDEYANSAYRITIQGISQFEHE